jgi:hypothetical protein
VRADIHFHEHYMPEPNSGCWIWLASINKRGYGQLMDNQSRQLLGLPDRHPALAHRVSWTLHYGSIPNGFHVLHRCDQRWCVNPDHLFIGTNHDNCLDASQKGRLKGKNHAVGEQVATAKLNEDIVRQILTSKERGRYVARRLRVTEALISAIRHRKIWKHVEL